MNLRLQDRTEKWTAIIFVGVMAVIGIVLVVGRTHAAPKSAKLERQVKILQQSAKIMAIKAKYDQCSSEMNDWSNQAGAIGAERQREIDKAFEEAGLKKGEWELNLDTFEFQKPVPTPPAPAPAQPTPAPAKK